MEPVYWLFYNIDFFLLFYTNSGNFDFGIWKKKLQYNFLEKNWWIVDGDLWKFDQDLMIKRIPRWDWITREYQSVHVPPWTIIDHFLWKGSWNSKSIAEEFFVYFLDLCLLYILYINLRSNFNKIIIALTMCIC